MSPSHTTAVQPKRTLVNPLTKQRPQTVDLLNDWQYTERAIQRILAGWGRDIAEWDDKSALHRQIWDQAECVRRLRDRVAQFPGGKPDASVSSSLESLVNAILLAPSLNDALDGLYVQLLKCLVSAYGEYCSAVHPIHDAPTVALLHEINQIKSQQWLWYRDYRRRHPHHTNASYKQKVEEELAKCGFLRQPQPLDPARPARQAGIGTGFQPRLFSARNQPIRSRFPFTDYILADFTTNIEARRLFWAYGYMLEKNLPDDQLLWLYYGDYMPWQWHHDISRHLWDESRHGDSGYSRLKDFGISLEEVGFPGSGRPEQEEILSQLAKGKGLSLDEAFKQNQTLLAPYRHPPMDKKRIYEDVFHIGMVAETGHFVVKNESYVDFKEGQDLESAEMMLFDIIDETAHVQYAHRWLPELARHAGIDNSDYRDRAAKERASLQAKATAEAARLSQTLSRSPDDPAHHFYIEMLERIRKASPLSNATTCPPRSQKPM